MRRRRVALAWLACLGVVVAAGAVGTGGVTSVVADRPLSVAVADDGAAFLGVEQTPTVDDGAVDLLVTVTNRVPSATTLDVTVTVDGRTNRTTVRDRSRVSFAGVPCAGTVAVEARGPGVAVDLERPVACPADGGGPDDGRDGRDDRDGEDDRDDRDGEDDEDDGRDDDRDDEDDGRDDEDDDRDDEDDEGDEDDDRDDRDDEGDGRDDRDGEGDESDADADGDQDDGRDDREDRDDPTAGA